MLSFKAAIFKIKWPEFKLLSGTNLIGPHDHGNGVCVLVLEGLKDIAFLIPL